MTSAGNRQSLLRGCGGEEGAGAAEEDVLQLSPVELRQQLRTQHHGAAAAAGAAAVDILTAVENQIAAVRQLAADAHTLFPEQMQQHFLSQGPQIPGDNQVKILRGGVKILQMGLDGGKGGRGRSQG